MSSAASDGAVQTGAKGWKQMHDAGAVTHGLGPAPCQHQDRQTERRKTG